MIKSTTTSCCSSVESRSRRTFLANPIVFFLPKQHKGSSSRSPLMSSASPFEVNRCSTRELLKSHFPTAAKWCNKTSELFIWSIQSSTVFDWLCLSQNQLGNTSGASVFAMRPGKTSASLALLLFSWHQVSTSSAICDDVEAWKYLWTLLKLCKSRYHSCGIQSQNSAQRRCISTSRPPFNSSFIKPDWKIASTTFASWLVLNQLKEALAGTRALARPHQEIGAPYISHFSMLFHPFFCWTMWKNTHKQKQKWNANHEMSIGRAAAISLSRNSLVRKMSSKSSARSRHTQSSAPTERSLSLWPTSSP